jgi:nucleoside-diphosphate-sugar epimerase
MLYAQLPDHLIILMRVFVSGATGFIGAAVVKELIAAGHEVLGLARSEAAAAALTAAGAAVHWGSLEDVDSLRKGALGADGVIHTAFIHDFSKYADNCETDRKVITAMGAALEGTGKPLVITSGTAVMAVPGRTITEEDTDIASSSIPRIASEQAAAAVAARGVKVSVVRLPPSVHDAGDHGFVPMLINLARQKSESAFIGDGQNRWPAVHRLDAARVFRLALEKAADHATYHAIGDEGVPVRDIAAIIAERLQLPLASKSPEEAAAHFGWLSHFLALDTPATGKLTEQWLNWQPTHCGLMEDMKQADYFKNEG